MKKDNIKRLLIDGADVAPTSSYKFPTTGEHIYEVELKEPMTSANSMFNSCWQLTSLDLSKWDTSNVTNMGSMFKECSKLTSLDLSNWDTSNVTNMGSMFKECSKLTSLESL